jgi:hypothetical protein
MTEFKNRGGALNGREERYDGFQGEPKHIGGELLHGITKGHKKHDSAGDVEGMHAQNVSKKPTMGDKLNPKVDADGDGKRGIMD